MYGFCGMKKQELRVRLTCPAPSFQRPATARSNELLPMPLWPATKMDCPPKTSREKCCTKVCCTTPARGGVRKVMWLTCITSAEPMAISLQAMQVAPLPPVSASTARFSSDSSAASSACRRRTLTQKLVKVPSLDTTRDKPCKTVLKAIVTWAIVPNSTSPLAYLGPTSSGATANVAHMKARLKVSKPAFANIRRWIVSTKPSKSMANRVHSANPPLKKAMDSAFSRVRIKVYRKPASCCTTSFWQCMIGGPNRHDATMVPTPAYTKTPKHTPGDMLKSTNEKPMTAMLVPEQSWTKL
mmetsp:Transcript_23720/g.68229  ORF Transcript_23720/g.68229 Transcript_23720/m.68229 type:complete len:298 (-) Transcript_23720:666-1559(-)